MHRPNILSVECKRSGNRWWQRLILFFFPLHTFFLCIRWCCKNGDSLKNVYVYLMIYCHLLVIIGNQVGYIL